LAQGVGLEFKPQYCKKKMKKKEEEEEEDKKKQEKAAFLFLFSLPRRR
jgi:hypothetical protein